MDISIDPEGTFLTLHIGGNRYRFHAIWLRDNAHDAQTRAIGNGQRLITLSEIPANTIISHVLVENPQSIKISFSPEEKTILYDIGWLVDHAYDCDINRQSGWLSNEQTPWNSSLMKNIPTVDFDILKQGGPSLNDWLEHIVKYGFATVKNAPIKEGGVFDLVDLFGYVRETNYGRHFEVRTEINPTNLAFTGLGLQAHTDNPYRDPVPTVQVLYCLESSAAGGENMVVDGFAAALRLRDENQRYFDILAKYCARFEYQGETGVHLASRRPMIELAPDGALIGIRFNNRSLAAIQDVPFDDMETYYSAYRRFGEIIDDPEMEVTFRLDPGQAFVVDNTRVLHARKGYSGSGKRWLQGCYADIDNIRSRYNAYKKHNKRT